MSERVPLTKKQRDAILFRDDNHSQMQHYSEEKGFYTNDACQYDGKPCTSLHIHHIEPVGAGGQNLPENLITVSECEHTGRCPAGRLTPGHYRGYYDK